jgi:hypothetical protein
LAATTQRENGVPRWPSTRRRLMVRQAWRGDRVSPEATRAIAVTQRENGVPRLALDAALALGVLLADLVTAGDGGSAVGGGVGGRRL